MKLQNLLKNYRSHRNILLRSVILFFGTMLYVLAKSPYDVLWLPRPTILLLVILVFFIFLTWQDWRKTPTAKNLLRHSLPSLLATIPFVLIAPHIDSVIPGLISLIGFIPIPLIASIVTWNLFRAARKEQNKPQKTSLSSKELIPLLMIVAGFLFFALSDIGKQAIVDEPLWIYDRVERPWDAISRGELQYARPSDKPGMTISALSSLALTAHANPSELKGTSNIALLEQVVTLMRVPIVIFVAILLPLLYLCVRQLLGHRTALYALGMIGLSPLIIGMSRIINPDAIFWILMPLTILSFMLALEHQKKSLMILSALLFGLVLLTKYVGTILYVFLPMTIIFFAIQKNLPRSEIRRHFLFYGGFVLGSVLLYSILLPSVWVSPVHILEGTLWSQAFKPIWIPFLITLTVIYIDLFISKASLLTKLTNKLHIYRSVIVRVISSIILISIGLTLVTSLTHTLIDYGLALESPKSVIANTGYHGAFFGGFYVLIYGVHMVALILFVFTIARLHKIKNSLHQSILTTLSFFIPFYYIGSTLAGVSATVRYQITLYPLLFIISAYGLHLLLQDRKAWLQSATIILLGSSMLLSLLATRPFYQSYANQILPSGDILFSKDMGNGSYQAAEILNALPDAAKLSVWSDKQGVCDFFVGACETTISLKDIERDDLTFDYYVISRGRQKLTVREANRQLRRSYVPDNPLIFERLYTSDIPTLETIILGNNPANFVKIIDADIVDIHQASL